MFHIYNPDVMRFWQTDSMGEADFFASLGYVVHDWNFMEMQNG